MPATIKDIAKTLGVSVSTVSYALNDGPRSVRQDVKDKIVRLAQELDYRPNSHARSLITRRTNTIGIVPSEPAQNVSLFPYFERCLTGVINEAEALGQDVLLHTCCDQLNVQRFVGSLRDGRVDGAIFVAPRVDSPVLELIRGKIPFVLISTERAGIESFVCDNSNGVFKGLRHLFDLGHRRIGHIEGLRTHQDGLERIEAFRSTIKELGLEICEDWIVNGEFHPMVGYQAAKKILSQRERPTALFCSNDDMASGAVRAAFDLGLRVPQDISIVGFDDAPFASVMYPSLTTLRQPFEQVGARAMKALVRQIEGDASEPHANVFTTELMIRGSTARV